MQPNNPLNQDKVDQPQPQVSEPLVQDSLVREAANIERSALTPEVSNSLNPHVDASFRNSPTLPTQDQASMSTTVQQQAVKDVSNSGLPGLPPVPLTKKRSRKVIFIVITLICLIPAGYLGYVTFFTKNTATNPLTQIVENASTESSELVNTTTENTTYLRPKNWAKIDEDGHSYGTGQRRGETSSIWDAIVVVSQQPSSPELINASPDVYNHFRETRESIIVSEGIVDVFIQRTGIECNSRSTTFTGKLLDYSVRNSTIGLFSRQATCSKPEGNVTVKERTVIGKDGARRDIVLLAIDSEWQKNKDAFQQMLDSIEQAP